MNENERSVDRNVEAVPLTPEERERHGAIIRDPDHWPWGDRLPVKRYLPGTSHEDIRLGSGFMLREELEHETVRVHDTTNPEDERVIVYASVGNLMDDGWRVD